MTTDPTPWVDPIEMGPAYAGMRYRTPGALSIWAPRDEASANFHTDRSDR